MLLMTFREDMRSEPAPWFYFISDVGAGKKPTYLAASSIPISTMASGTIKFFNSEKGFGFITPDAGGKDVFVHKTGTREALWEGDKVNYEVEETPKGLNAINVTKA